MRHRSQACVILLAAAAFGALAGCANPGPPKPPSLGIPAAVTDLSAIRRGDAVDLQFTLPQHTTDGQILRPGAMVASVCRALDAGVCVPVPALKASSFPVPSAPKTPGGLRDALPPNLTIGAPHLLIYRIALRNTQGRSGEYSAAAYALAGAAPATITDLGAQGSRLGTVLTWRRGSAQDDVLLRREYLGPHIDHPASRREKSATGLFGAAGAKKMHSENVLLNANGDSHGASDAGETLDTSAEADVPYRYTGERRRTVSVDGHTLQMWSGAGAPIIFTLHDTFPPPAPTALSIAGFSEADASGKENFFVDLIWEPVQDEQLAGYRVYREDPTSGAKELLSSEPVKAPAFRDATANSSRRYRYLVTSVDLKGNESAAATAVLEPQRH